MAEFPRTEIENLSVSRLIMGTNWWLGFSHTSQAKDRQILEWATRERLAGIMETFLRAGVDTILGIRSDPKLEAAMKDAEDRAGRGLVRIGTPGLNIADGQTALDETARILDEYASIGTRVCMPHQQTTDALLDRTTRSIRRMDTYCAMIRQRGMIPGLSTHMPESVVYADETGLDVAAYIQIYNAVGFLMQLEVDWVHKIIWGAKHPVIAIKPMGVNRLCPLAGLAFAWATLRKRDMVCVGTMTADEAKELIEISLALLERRAPGVQLQRTRSKTSVEKR